MAINLKEKKIIWHLTLIYILFLAENIIPLPANAESIKVEIEAAKSFFKPDEPVSVSINIINPSETRIGPLRIYFRLMSPGGKIIAYRNRYPGYIGKNPLKIPFQIDTGLLKPTKGIYPCKVLIFIRGKQIAEKESYIVFADSIPSIELMPVLELNAPFRITLEGNLDSEEILQTVVGGSRENAYLDMITSNKTPAVLVASSGFLTQLQKMSGGYKVKTDSGLTERKADSEQCQAIKKFLEKLRVAAKKENVLIAFMPYGEANPKDFIELGLSDRLRILIVRGQKLSADSFLLSTPPSIIFIPHRGLDQKSLRIIADMGFQTAIDADSTYQNSFLAENTSIFVRKTITPPSELKGAEAAEFLLREITARQLKDNEPSTVMININAIDPVIFSTFMEKAGKTGFIDFASKKTANLKPLAFIETKSFYGDFASLTKNLITRYKEVQSLVAAYNSSLLGDGSYEKSVNQKLDYSLMPSFNLKPDYNLSFQYLSTLKEIVEDDFKGIAVSEKNIIFPQKTGKIPITIANKSKRVFKVKIKLSSEDIDFNNPQFTMVLSSSDNLVTVPAKVKVPGGKIGVDVEIFTIDGYLIKKDRLTVKSTYLSTMLSYLGMLVLAMFFLFFLRSRLKSRRG